MKKAILLLAVLAGCAPMPKPPTVEDCEKGDRRCQICVNIKTGDSDWHLANVQCPPGTFSVRPKGR